MRKRVPPAWTLEHEGVTATGRSAGVALVRKAWEGIFNGPPGYNSDYQNFFDIYSPWLPEFPSSEVGAIELEEFQAVIKGMTQKAPGTDGWAASLGVVEASHCGLEAPLGTVRIC